MNGSLFPNNMTSAPFLLDSNKNLAGQQATVNILRKQLFCAIKQNSSAVLKITVYYLLNCEYPNLICLEYD